MLTQIINNENKPEYGSKEYNRIAQRKSYYLSNGKEKSRDKYYNSKYGRLMVQQFKEQYGEDYIKHLKMEGLRRKLSDLSSDSSNHGNDSEEYI
jgi:hypothetical protein